jgi:antitoxin (DNA-binding transcriptional repressor) of toxin-antitoxin stability system
MTLPELIVFAVKTISTTELRSKTRALVRSLENGNAVGLTHRGRKLAQIYPLRKTNGISADDPLYQFHRHASKKAKPLSDREIDEIIYGG